MIVPQRDSLVLLENFVDDGLCERGWKAFFAADNGYCYAVKEAFYFSLHNFQAWYQRLVSQSEAKRICRLHKSNLVSIISSQEDNFVLGWFFMSQIRPWFILDLAHRDTKITKIWIGLEYRVESLLGEHSGPNLLL